MTHGPDIFVNVEVLDPIIRNVIALIDELLLEEIVDIETDYIKLYLPQHMFECLPYSKKEKVLFENISERYMKAGWRHVSFHHVDGKPTEIELKLYSNFYRIIN